MEPIQIVAYSPEYQPDFERFNRQWIEQYFWMEEIDRSVLKHPEEAIINDGGFILMALHEGKAAGTVAVKKLDARTYELTKMAVDPACRQLGLGGKLCMQAVARAEELGAGKIILYSHTRLEPAIRLYKRLGFREVDLEGGVYARANIKMEKLLRDEQPQPSAGEKNAGHG